MPKFGTVRFGTFTFGDASAARTAGYGVRVADAMFSSRGYYLINGRAAKFVVPGDPILSNFGIYVKGSDMATNALKEAIERTIISYELKFYIQDSSNPPLWVDFSDRTEWRGKNQLRKVGSLEYSAERMRGALQQKMSTITLDNSDSFWDKKIPSTVKGTYDQDWNLVSEADCDTTWDLSTGAKETALYHHKAAIRAHFRVRGSDAVEILTLGVFLIEDITTSSDEAFAEIKLAPMSSPLINNTAEVVKSGNSWYQNRSPKSLIEQILKKEYATSTGLLPSTYDIENVFETEIPFAEVGTKNWGSSAFGRPPENTVNYAGSSTAWNIGEVRICRAMCLWEYGVGSGTAVGSLGTITVTPGSDTIVGSGTQWNTSGKQKPRVGDAFVIPKSFVSGDGGSENNCQGKYVITEITDDTHIVVDKPVDGDATESGLKYSIPRLYLGVGSELYEYNVATDLYRQLTQNSSTIGTTYAIRRLWHNPNDDTYPIWGVALTDLGERDDVITQSMLVFRFYWNSTTPTVDIFGGTGSPVTGVFFGDYVLREGDRRGGFTNSNIGNIGGSYGSDMPPITILYTQTVTNNRIPTGDHPYVFSNDDFDTAATAYNGSGLISQSSDDYEFGGTAESFVLKRGYHSLAGNVITPPFSIRYSIGQDGFLVFNVNYGTKGAIVFSKTSLPTYDSSASANNAPEYSATYHFIDLSQSDPGSSAPTVTNMTSGTPFTISGIDYLTGYLPVCGCADPSTDDIYIGMSRFRVASVSVDSAILKITNLATTPTVSRLFYESSSTNKFFYTMICSTQKLFIGEIDLEDIRGVNPNSPYTLKIHAKTGEINGAANLSTKHVSRWMYQGLQIMDIESGSPSTRLFYHCPERGLIAYVNDDDTQQTDSDASPPTVVAVIPPVAGDVFHLNSTIVSSSNMTEMYWISSSAPVFNIANRAEGKFYLCKWSHTAAIRIELADFSGMTQWDAIDQITEVASARFGFKPDGNFFFKAPPRHSYSQYSFTNVGQNRLASITKQRGLEYIINFATKTPHRPQLGDLKINIRLTANSKFGEIPEGGAGDTEKFQHKFEAVQRDIEAKTIRLVCVEGGRTAVAGATEESTREAKFKWTINKATATTQITAQYDANDPSIEMEAPEDVVYGTAVDLKGLASISSTEEVVGSTKIGLKVTYSSGQLTINGAIDSEQSVIPVHILGDTDPTNNANLTSGNIDSVGRNLIPGDIILIGNTTTGENFEYMQILWCDSQVMHVIRGIGTGIMGGAISHEDDEYIVLIRNAYTVFLDANSKINQLFIIGAEATLTHPDSAIWSDSMKIDPNDTSSTASAEQYWYPVNGRYVPIGGRRGSHDTGLSLQLTYAGSRSSEPSFSIGDIITIETKGLVLSQDVASIKVHSDISSQRIWRRREDNSDNRFYNDRTARWAAQRTVEDNAHPKYIFEIDGVITPWLDLLEVIEIQEPNMLQNSPERTEACYITSIGFDLNTKGGMRIVARGIESY